MSVTFRLGAESLRVPILMISRRVPFPAPVRFSDDVESLTEELRQLALADLEDRLAS